jgi:hypothetical protein
MYRSPVQGGSPSSRPIFLPFLLDHNTKLLLESTFPQKHYERADKDSRSHHDQHKKHYLLERVDRAEIDGTQARQSHRADNEKQSVDEPDTVCWSTRSPEDYRRDQACHHEVGVVNRDEVARRQPAAKLSPRLDERPRKSHWMNLMNLMDILFSFSVHVNSGGLSSTDRVCGFSFWELEHVDLTKGS